MYTSKTGALCIAIAARALSYEEWIPISIQERPGTLADSCMHSCRFDAELAAFAVILPAGSGVVPITQSTGPAGTTDSCHPRSTANSGDRERRGGTHDGGEFYLDPAVVRRADTSAASVNEWTGERTSRDADVADDVRPASVAPLGNYAVSWGS